jgi:hypothetical protein
MAYRRALRGLFGDHCGVSQAAIEGASVKTGTVVDSGLERHKTDVSRATAPVFQSNGTIK